MFSPTEKPKPQPPGCASHPEIQLVSRDPGRGLCCCGTDIGSPGDSVRRPVPSDDQAFRKSLEGVLSRHLAAHRTRVDLESRTTPLSPVQGKGPPKKHPKHAQVCQAKREERLAQYQQVVALRKQGFSQTAIAAQVGVGHATVSRWLSNGTFPEHKSRKLKGRKKSASDSQLPRATVLARDAVFLLLRRPRRTGDRRPRNASSASISASMPVDQAYELVQQFTRDSPHAHRGTARRLAKDQCGPARSARGLALWLG